MAHYNLIFIVTLWSWAVHVCCHPCFESLQRKACGNHRPFSTPFQFQTLIFVKRFSLVEHFLGPLIHTHTHMQNNNLTHSKTHTHTHSSLAYSHEHTLSDLGCSVYKSCIELHLSFNWTRGTVRRCHNEKSAFQGQWNV